MAYDKDKPPQPDAASSDSDDDEDYEDEAEVARKMAIMKARGARKSVMAESTKVDADWKAPVFPKSDEQMEMLKKAMSKSFIFSSIMQDNHLVESIVGAFEGPRQVSPGTTVIKQGDNVSSGEPGFYIIESGELDVHKSSEQQSAPGLKVFTYTSMGQSFGELALLYNAPRAATVTATSSSVLWSLEREVFHNCVVGGIRALREELAGFLKSVSMLEALTDNDIDRLVDIIKLVTFQSGDKIITQGDEGTDFFLLHKGSAAAIVNGESVKDYKTPGQYFGELALIEKAPRKVDVVATATPTTVAVIDSEAFTNILGSLHDLMKEHAKDYTPLPK